MLKTQSFPALGGGCCYITASLLSTSVADIPARMASRLSYKIPASNSFTKTPHHVVHSSMCTIPLSTMRAAGRVHRRNASADFPNSATASSGGDAGTARARQARLQTLDAELERQCFQVHTFCHVTRDLLTTS